MRHVYGHDVAAAVAALAATDPDEATAIALANGSRYGLASGVWSTDLKRVHRFIREIESGNVWVNTYLQTRFGNYSQKTGSFFFLLSRMLGAAARQPGGGYRRPRGGAAARQQPGRGDPGPGAHHLGHPVEQGDLLHQRAALQGASGGRDHYRVPVLRADPGGDPLSELARLALVERE